MTKHGKKQELDDEVGDVELDYFEPVDEDQNPDEWKEKLKKEFGDVPRVVETLEKNLRINFEAFYYTLNQISMTPAKAVLTNALDKITGEDITNPTEFINAAALIITLDLYPRELLPDTIQYKDEEYELNVLISYVTEYLVSLPVTNALEKEDLAMPLTIYKYAGIAPPPHAPRDEELFPWLSPAIKLTDEQSNELSQSTNTLMPSPTRTDPESIVETGSDSDNNIGLSQSST